jgi:rhodanese-related sulfurtransferase
MNGHHHYIITLLVTNVIICSGCFSVKSNDQFTYKKLDVVDYRKMLMEADNRYLIDVRTQKEFDTDHINGATNFSLLAFHFRKDVRNLDRTKPVFLYCQTCHRSPLAARKMKRMGFVKVYDLVGGYKEWNTANSPEK